MLVTSHNFDQALKSLIDYAKDQKVLGFDTETTCLNWWDSPHYDIKPRVFSMQFATDKEEFYFDFNHSSDKLGDEHFKKINSELTQNPDILWMIANAKFDLHHSANHGVLFKGTIHDTKAIARVVDNLEPKLGLDDLSEKYLGANKLDVISILKERGHATRIKRWGRNERTEEILHFDRLELHELLAYGKKDTRLVFDLGVFQVRKILQMDKTIFSDKPQKLSRVMYNEYKLTQVCFEMEREGVKIDRAYTEKAYEHEVSEYTRIEQDLNRISGTKVDWLSAKQLKPIFEKMGESYGYTEKGNACFDRDALEESDSELAKLILKYRYHNKRAHTYFENFIWLADTNDIVHADAQPAGTQTGRMSYWNPNLQNVPKRRDKDEIDYKVRRCFVPKPGRIFADFDYSGAEYYMTVDYAKELTVIDQLKAGIDPHAELGKKMNLKDRDTAKTMQFRILYGAGQEAIGKSLGYKGYEAKKIGKEKKQEYFQNMPKVAELLWTVSETAKRRGYIFNWAGRVLRYDQQTAYKSPNGLIQSGVGDMTKFAMTKIADELLVGRKSKMVLQVHDAILFELFPDELDLIPQIKEAMCSVYPHKILKMEADAGFSDKDWSSLTDGVPPVS